MKHSTAMSRLSDVVDGLDRAAAWPETMITTAFAFAGMLDGETDFDRIERAFVVAEPAEVVPWMARPARLGALAATLNFTKLPLSWRWRPAEVAGLEPRDRARAAGVDRGWRPRPGRPRRMATRRLDDVTLDTPASSDALITELLVERDVGRRHLAAVAESFYNEDWRREHRGDGIHAEDHLWWATAAFLELDDAIQRLTR